MTSATTADLMAEAYAAGHAVGAFNVICLEHAEAIVDGAERAGLPVILQVSENTVAYHGDRLAPIGLACLSLASTASVPVALHLDHATREALCFEAIELGFGSVMFDASTLEYEENVRATATLAASAHARGAFVEAELGVVGGKDGSGPVSAHAPGARTDPAEAAAFVTATGVNALAVAVGTSHAMTSRDAVIDVELIEKLRAGVPVPLVLHGSSGVSDELLVSAVRAGMTKVNIATHLNKAMTERVRVALAANTSLVDPRLYLGSGRSAVAAEVSRLLTLLALHPSSTVAA